MAVTHIDVTFEVFPIVKVVLSRVKNIPGFATDPALTAL